MNERRGSVSDAQEFEISPVTDTVQTKSEHKKRRILPLFVDLADFSTSDEHIQDLLDMASTRSQYRALRKAGLITDLSHLGRKAGLHFDGRQTYLLAASVKNGEIPYGRMPLEFEHEGVKVFVGYYHFSATIHEERAIKAFGNDASLDGLRKNPVAQVSGPTKDIPLPYQFISTDQYVAAGKIIMDILQVKNFLNLNFRVIDVIQHSPVTTFHFLTGNTYFLDRKDEAEFRTYCISRLEELRALESRQQNL